MIPRFSLTVRRPLPFVRWSLLCALVVSLTSSVWADPIAPGPNDRYTVLTVTQLLRQQHLSRHPFDKEISERCLSNFLKYLDSMKLYFYQSDIDEFSKHKDELAESIPQGNLDFAYEVFRVFLKRVDERQAMASELLAGPLDFNTDEQMARSRETATYARTPAEAMERWRQRVKYDMLLLKSADKKGEKKEGQAARDKLKRRYASIAKRMHQTNSEELLEAYLNAFTMAFDPHTDYMSPDTQKNFNIAMSLELEGIAASLRSEDGYPLVKRIAPGGAADKDRRIKIDDKVISVGQGETGEMVDIVDMKLNDVVKMIRGKPGTKVRLEVVPANGSPTQIYTIAREKIALKDNEAQAKIFDAGRKPDGSPYRLGIIKLPSFYRDTDAERLGHSDFKSATGDVRAILDDFRSKQVDAVVVDLRGNGGGALQEAIGLTSLFVGGGPVVQVKGPYGGVLPYSDNNSTVVWSGPLVVVIDKFSASASEIFAGAIQDYGRGLIIGDHATHGKGTVQSLLDVYQQVFKTPPPPGESMGALKITMQKFYRPDGDSTQLRGVESDVELPSTTNHMEGIGEADLDYPLPFDRVASSEYKRFSDVSPTVCDQLRKLSEQRVQHSDQFRRVLRKIACYKELKASKYISLNETKFLKQRAELKPDQEEDKIIDNMLAAEIKRDYYLDEVMAITADYLNIENVAKAPGSEGQTAGTRG
jgi:carboxyl-terminal processing protease